MKNLYLFLTLCLLVPGLQAQCPDGVFPDFGFDPAQFDAKMFTIQLTNIDPPDLSTSPPMYDYLAALDPDGNIVGCGLVSFANGAIVASMQIYFDCGSGGDPAVINCNSGSAPDCTDCEDFTLIYYDTSAMMYFPILIGIDQGPATEFAFVDADMNNQIDGYTAVEAVSGTNATDVDTGAGQPTFEDLITALPVTYLSLEAKPRQGRVNVDWSTATESGNSHFIIEHSLDGAQFTQIGRAEGAGDSKTTSTYRYLDEQPAKGMNYYRLLQVDYSGRSSYSGIVSAVIGQERVTDLRLYPNPSSSGQVTVSLDGNWAELVEFQIHDLSGRTIRTWKATVSASQIIDVSNLPTGIYELRVSDERGAQSKKMVIR